MTRSTASSIRSMVMDGRRWRAASSAASFARLARSAPVNPGVRRAMVSTSTLSSVGLDARCTPRMRDPALEVGTVDGDLAIEATRAQQGRVQDVGPVGGGDHDDPAGGVEAVHLDQQLVEGLFALVVAAAHAGTAMAADGVDLVDEDDGRRLFLGLLEQVPHPAGTDADEHLDEVGSRDREERHPGLAGHRPGEQGLAGARWAVEQHALGDLGSHGVEAGRIREELLDLAQLLDGLVGTRRRRRR